MGLRELAALGGALGCTAFAAAGCGDSGTRPVDAGGRIAAQEPVVATTPETPAAEPADKTTQPPARSFAVEPLIKLEERATARLRALRETRREGRELAATEHARATLGAVRDLVEALLVSAGLEFATYDVLDGGKTVVVDIARKDACALGPDEPIQIQDRIVDASDIVERVRLRLVPTGSLPAYRRAHCHTTKTASAGLGATLLTVARDGVMETKPFRVTRSRWTIEWSSTSTLLQIYVYKDGRLRSLAVDEQGRGSGTRTLTGSGTYTLRVAGTARWRVRVRDGASTSVKQATPESAPTDAP